VCSSDLALGEYAQQAGIAGLVVMTGAAAAARGYGEAANIAKDYQQAANWSAPVLEQGGTVLVKGSRSAGMEAVVRLLATQEHTLTQGAR
jgi:UDP-N-acetylmuramoyl-tripeptide--D-alanyl-D-alanine ligase